MNRMNESTSYAVTRYILKSINTKAKSKYTRVSRLVSSRGRPLVWNRDRFERDYNFITLRQCDDLVSNFRQLLTRDHLFSKILSQFLKKSISLLRLNEEFQINFQNFYVDNEVVRRLRDILICV